MGSIPGGPGADSRYLESLVEILDIKDNVFLIDFPGSGDNQASNDYNYQDWFGLLPRVLVRYKNPILVGHSFGGVAMMLNPELEDLAKKAIILNSAPSLWLLEAQESRKAMNIPDVPQREVFKTNPCQETYDQFLKAYLPYCFQSHSVEAGMRIFEDLPYPVDVAGKVLQLLTDMKYSATWIPEHVPTLIIGGSDDAIVPFSIFNRDKRFCGKGNIIIHEIQNAGHWAWIDQPFKVKELIEAFAN